MKEKRFSFRFDSLEINLKTIYELLGYTDGFLPSPFDSYLQEALDVSGDLQDISAIYKIIDDIHLNPDEKTLIIRDQIFRIGKTVFHELRGSEKIALFVCTAGKTISDKAEILLKSDDPVIGYVYNVLGNAIAESAGNCMQSILRREVGMQGMLITNRYSPGYCQWNVAEQHKLFALFDQAPCGVTLRTSGLMQPVKSISGVIGIGSRVKYREYQCSLCPMTGCIYRRTEKSRP